MELKETTVAIAVVAIISAAAVVGIVMMNDQSRPAGETFTITYVLNEGTNSPDNPSTYVSGTTVELKAATREGYVFLGWASDAELTTEVTKITKDTKGDLTLYAAWEETSVGTSMTYSLSGTIKNGLGQNTGTITGSIRFCYLAYEYGSGYLVKRDQTTTVTTALGPNTSTDIDTYWSGEIDTEWTQGSDKTIETAFGTKECQTWISKGMNSTETQYIGDDGITYLIEYVTREGFGIMNTTTTSITYSLTEIGVIDPAEESVVTRVYDWTYDNCNYHITLDIDVFDYLKYRDDTAAVREQRDNTHDSIYFTTDDKYIGYVADRLNEFAAGKSSLWKANLILSFVQSTEYVTDDVSRGQEEWWKYPVETLYDMNGDCEDTSFLFATIAMRMGYDCCTMIFSDHMAAGIVVDGCSGYYYEHDSKHYYYCETTSDEWMIGHQPDSKYVQKYVKRYVVPS